MLLSIILSLHSCATYRVKFKHEYIPGTQISDASKAKFVVYLIGDAGNAPENQTTTELAFLKLELEKEEENSAIVWLGDNIYPVGMPDTDHPDYGLSKHRLIKQLECHDAYNGKTYFIPGNHDWYASGVDGILRQEKIVENYLQSRSKTASKFQSNYFFPDNACGDIHSIALNDDIILILMDSNWYLQKDRSVFNNCSYSESAQFLENLKSEIRMHKGKQLIVCLHHPPYSYGPHGSHFSFKDYVFPITQIKSSLWIPMPFSGIVFNQMRGFFTEQDTKNVKYRLLREVLDEELKQFKNPIIASGHEHNLQLIVKDSIHYIVSGAGSKANPVALGKYSEFAIGKKGYVKLYFFENKYTIEYIIPSNSNQQVIYSKTVVL